MSERAAVMGIEEADLRERLRQSVPLQRWTRPEDLAAAATFLASQDSVHMTGEHLIVSGGLSGGFGRRAQAKVDFLGALTRTIPKVQTPYC